MSDDITMTDITKQQFELYVKIQRSGQFNMLDAGAVEMESEYELDRDTQRVIRRHYAELAGKFGVRA